MVDYSCDEIERQLRQLKEFSARLGDSMERSASGLRTQGTSPSAELITDLQNYRDEFFKMRSWLQDQSDQGNQSVKLAPGTLTELETELTTKMTRSRALELISCIQGLSHVEGDRHLAVAVCQQACETARDEILGEGSKSDETAAALNHGQHPLAILRTLVTHSDTLDDTQWTEMLEQCGKQLGREVATAVARHKLVIRNTNS